MSVASEAAADWSWAAAWTKWPGLDWSENMLNVFKHVLSGFETVRIGLAQ